MGLCKTGLDCRVKAGTMEITMEMKRNEIPLNSQRAEIKDICAFLDKNKEPISDLYI